MQNECSGVEGTGSTEKEINGAKKERGLKDYDLLYRL